MDFTSLLIVDCKATIWEKPADQPAGQTEEIIAIDIALIDTTRNQISERDSFIVKPKKSTISDYCYRLFGVSPTQAQQGVPFEDVYRKLRIHYMSPDRIWGTWSLYDKWALDHHLKHSNLEPLFKLKHHDLQKLYATMTGSTEEYLTIQEALKLSGEPYNTNRAVSVANLWCRMAKGLRPLVSKSRLFTPNMFHSN